MPGSTNPCEIRGREIKLLAIDLDGTLLTHERVIGAGAVDAVRRAVDRGIMVALASGRIYPSLKPFADQLGLTGPFICANGAHIIDNGGKELAFKALDPAARELVMGYAQEKDLHLNAYTRSELLLLRETRWSEMYRQRARAVIPRISTSEELMNAQISKMMLVGEPEQISKLREEVEPKFNPDWARLTESEPEYLEFLAPTAHKGAALRLLAEELGIHQEQTAAIGDYLNDVEMLKWAGLSAAVENAAPEAKAVSNVIVRSNEGGGVVQFIDSHVLNG